MASHPHDLEAFDVPPINNIMRYGIKPDLPR